MPSRRSRQIPPAPQRGSAIITALVLAAITAVITASFLFRATQEVRLANRSVYQAAALNLAEAGLEEGMFAINSAGFTTANGWSSVASTSSYTRTISSISLPQGTGTIHIRVDDPNASYPVVIAAGVVEIPRQPRMVRQLRLVLQKSTFSGSAIASKTTVTFSASTLMDSYDSSAGAYGGANISDFATVSAGSTSNGAISVNNAQIYGYAATGGGDPTVGSSGRIYGSTTPGGTQIDTSRVRKDYVNTLATPTVPTGTVLAAGVTNITSSITLPRSGHTAGSNGRYLYSVSSVNLSGSSLITINGPVDLIVTGNYATAGNSGIQISSGASPSLNLYLGGTTANIGGLGINNLTALPSTMNAYGTRASGQTVTVSGKQDTFANIFAPAAAVSLTGSMNFFGSLTGNAVSISSSGAFHYDIQLTGNASAAATASTLTPKQWLELTETPSGTNVAATATTGGTFTRDNRTPFTSLF